MDERQIIKPIEQSILEVLEKQYQEADNKKELDYWSPLSKIILESIELRDSRNMSQAELAEKMKTRQSVISRFENMGRLPNFDFISRLSIALGHKLGMTLYGDYMAVVPIDKQDLIKDMAEKKNMTTENFLQDLLEQSINRVNSLPTKLGIMYTASEDITNQNKQQENRTILPILTSNNTYSNIMDIAG